MEEHTIKETENKITSEEKMENHINSETNENNIIVDVVLPEKKPIKNILFVDDEESIRKLFKEALEKFGYKVMVASDGNEGMKLFRKNPADLIITDIFMPNNDGHAFIYDALQEFPEAKFFAITGKTTILGIENELDIAKTLGAMRVFAKPIKLSDLLDAITELSLPSKTVSE